MRKLLILFTGTLVSGSLIAGGLVTNTNQSALYTRLQSRNASTNIDAVYYNPAGLAKLGNGFHASINNQTIGQTKSVVNNYLYLAGSPKDYVGEVSAPVFPSIYGAFKAGKFVVSAGFNPIGGGGGAVYNDGLPSFETMVADLVPLLVSKGFPTTQYSADIFFEGTSVYFGYQANLTYKLNDMISVAAGVRMVTAKNTYNGHISDIMVNPNYPAFGAAFNGAMVPAPDFFNAGALTLNTLASGATSYVTGLQPIINGGGGSVLLANGTSVGLTAGQVAQIQQILGAAGQTPAQIGAATIQSAQTVLGLAAPGFTNNATQLSGYAAMTQDREVDAVQTGSGFSPILSLNISPMENLNIALKYEFKTALELTTAINGGMDGGGLFVEGDKTIADMPAMLAAGVEFKPISKLLLTGSMNMYMDKDVDYDGDPALDVNMIDKNFTEYALGAEYGLSDKMRISAGWLGTYTGVNENYQNDQRFSLNTNSFGGGIGYTVNPLIDINLGGQYTIYKEGTKAFTYMLGGTTPVPVTETYNKDTWVVAVGLDFHFGAK
jgi:long-subunit fatty acid transport protein